LTELERLSDISPRLSSRKMQLQALRPLSQSQITAEDAAAVICQSSHLRGRNIRDHPPR